MEDLLELDLDLFRLTSKEPLLYNLALVTSGKCAIDIVFLPTQRLIKLL